MKTFILMWRPAISSFTRERYEDFMYDFYCDAAMNWSVWEHDKAKRGDRFFMVKVGEDETGVVASGHFISEPYRGEDWSGKGRETYYMDIYIDHIFNPWQTLILSNDVLKEQIPDFDWSGGHSGRLLSVPDSQKLEQLWSKFLESRPDEIYSDDENLARERKPFTDVLELQNAERNPLIASLRGDLDTIKSIAKEHDLKDYKIYNFGADQDFPIWAIPKSLLYIIGNPEEWKSPYDEIVIPLKLRLEALINWWKDEMGVDADKDVDYQQFADYFFSSEMDDTPEDILLEDDIDALVKLVGCQMIDVDLYCAASRFDYAEVERLLKAGANQHAKLFDVEDIVARISTEASYLDTQWNHRWFAAIAEDGKINDVPSFMDELVGYAAHEKMFALLKKYDVEKA